MPRIFVSYRRADTEDIAARIADRLKDRFGRENVFVDIDNVPLGVDFRTHIENEIASCDFVVVVIGSNWVRDLTGEPDAEQSDDWVLLEVSAALKRDIPVIPVPVGTATLPRETELPAAIKALAYRNANEVRSGTAFDGNVDRLIRGMESAGTRRTVIRAALTLIVLVVAGVAALKGIEYLDGPDAEYLDTPDAEYLDTPDAEYLDSPDADPADEPIEPAVSVVGQDLAQAVETLKKSGFDLSLPQSGTLAVIDWDARRSTVRSQQPKDGEPTKIEVQVNGAPWRHYRLEDSLVWEAGQSLDLDTGRIGRSWADADMIFEHTSLGMKISPVGAAEISKMGNLKPARDEYFTCRNAERKNFVFESQRFYLCFVTSAGRVGWLKATPRTTTETIRVEEIRVYAASDDPLPSAEDATFPILYKRISERVVHMVIDQARVEEMEKDG